MIQSYFTSFIISVSFFYKRDFSLLETSFLNPEESHSANISFITLKYLLKDIFHKRWRIYKHLGVDCNNSQMNRGASWNLGGKQHALLIAWEH